VSGARAALRCLAAAALLLLPACAFLEGKVPSEPPPLLDMEEPLALHQVPDDEAERVALAPGSFTGAYVADARVELEAMDEDPQGVRVVRVVENSPAAAAGLEEGDLLLEVEWEGGRKTLGWSSEWRDTELKAKPGVVLRVSYDRAGVEREARIRTVPRLSPPPRQAIQRFREEERMGVVVRQATEVEARAAGLGPGGGAVVVGLSKASPLRAAGLRYEDLVVAVDGKPVSHPNVFLAAIRDAPAHGTLELAYRRGGKEAKATVPVTRRAQELKKFGIILLYSYEKSHDRKKVWFLLGLYQHESTQAAWQTRLFWLITLRGGDSDRLEEVDESRACPRSSSCSPRPPRRRSRSRA